MVNQVWEGQVDCGFRHGENLKKKRTEIGQRSEEKSGKRSARASGEIQLAQTEETPLYPEA